MKESLAPRDYIDLPTIYPGWKIADVGPGSYPLPRCDVYIDRSESVLAPIAAEGKETVCSSLEHGLPEIADKAFDYVWCSHVLEHVDDPIAAAATLSRIGRSGTIVVPSFVKEAMFNFEEPSHQWICMPHPAIQTILFIKQNETFIRRIRDIDVQKINCRLYRSGTSADRADDQYLREWYRLNEVHLDCVLHWYGELRIEVIK